MYLAQHFLALQPPQADWVTNPSWSIVSITELDEMLNYRARLLGVSNSASSTWNQFATCSCSVFAITSSWTRHCCDNLKSRWNVSWTVNSRTRLVQCPATSSCVLERSAKSEVSIKNRLHNTRLIIDYPALAADSDSDSHYLSFSDYEPLVVMLYRDFCGGFLSDLRLKSA
jgi:hypothetical protein